MAGHTPYQNKTVLLIGTKCSDNEYSQPYSLSERTHYRNSRLISEQFVLIRSTNGSIYLNKRFVLITNHTPYKCSDNETPVYALSKIEFWPLIFKNFKFMGFLGQKCPIAPPKQNFWLRHCC
jgi:hypothetical protein